MTGFHKDMAILDALARHPDGLAVFERHGMNCSSCPGVGTGTVESGAVLHQVDPQALLAGLNALEHVEARSL